MSKKDLIEKIDDLADELEDKKLNLDDVILIECTIVKLQEIIAVYQERL